MLLQVCIHERLQCELIWPSKAREERADTFQILQIQNDEQAARGGYAAGTIRTYEYAWRRLGGIYNSAEKVKNFKGMSQPAIMPPHSSKAGKNYQQAFGDVYTDLIRTLREDIYRISHLRKKLAVETQKKQAKF